MSNAVTHRHLLLQTTPEGRAAARTIRKSATIIIVHPQVKVCQMMRQGLRKQIHKELIIPVFHSSLLKLLQLQKYNSEYSTHMKHISTSSFAPRPWFYFTIFLLHILSHWSSDKINLSNLITEITYYCQNWSIRTLFHSKKVTDKPENFFMFSMLLNKKQ